MSSDKLGDKLKDKEKAEEDQYFARQETEQLAKLREKNSHAEALRGTCPRCATKMVEFEKEGIVLDACPSCGGVFFDKGELESVVERLGENWFSRWVRVVLSGAK